MRRPLPGLVLVLPLLVAGCERRLDQAAVTGLQSFRVTLLDPLPDPSTGVVGSAQAPLSPGSVTFTVEALGPRGERVVTPCTVDAECCPPGADCGAAGAPRCEDGQCALDARVFLSFAGNKVGLTGNCRALGDDHPLALVHLAGGVSAPVTTALRTAFGTATLWVEDPITAALGTSPLLYFAAPTIPDVQTPPDLSSSTFTWCSAWDGRHAIIDHATAAGSPPGQLVVTSVFNDSYVVADTGARFVAGADPSKDRGGFNHLYVYSFGRPPRPVVPGRVLRSLSGNVSKFIGFTELNFPLQEYDDAVVGTPPVYPLTLADRGASLGSSALTNQRMLRLDAATVSVTGSVCPIATDPADPNASQWLKFNQFTVDMGDGVCDSFRTYSVQLPAKTLGAFDPLAVMNRKTALATFTGMLRNSSGQNDACKGTAGPQSVACRGDADCAAAAARQADPTCRTNLGKASCVEGSCRRGVYNFWTVQLRSAADLQVH